ncbi:Rhodanese domain-containing protein [Pseudomonas coronafaciens pv. garcae]|nr:Rhodanese domain-containing protein [Pseudomonas coronafaciens pv. garcae]
MVAHLLEFATNHYLITGAFVILLALLIAYELSKGGASLSTRELTAMVNRDEAVVIDVRSKKDFTAGHIVGSLNFPQDKVLTRTVELQKYKDKTLIIVDAMGQHAGTTARELLKSGFKAAKLSGGISS